MRERVTDILDACILILPFAAILAWAVRRDDAPGLSILTTIAVVLRLVIFLGKRFE